jgi:hypothetical protein
VTDWRNVGLISETLLLVLVRFLAVGTVQVDCVSDVAEKHLLILPPVTSGPEAYPAACPTETGTFPSKGDPAAA